MIKPDERSPSRIQRELQRAPTHLKAALAVIMAPAILSSALMGMGGLTFFFSQQFFLETLGWSEGSEDKIIIADGLSIFAASMMILGYLLSLGPSVYVAVRNILRALYPDPLMLAASERDIEAALEDVHPDDQVFKLSALQSKEYNFITLCSVAALVIIGAGAFQGVMSVGDAFERHGALTQERATVVLWSAIVSAVGLFLAFASFTLPRLKQNLYEIYENSGRKLISQMMWKFLFIDSFKNIIAMFRSEPRNPIDTTALRASEKLRQDWSEQGIREQWIQSNRKDRSMMDTLSRMLANNLRKFIAVGSTLGFAIFKFYAVDELARTRYHMNDVFVDVLDVVSIVVLTVMTSLTSGKSIYDTFGIWAVRDDAQGGQNTGGSKIGRLMGWSLAIFLGVFMMAGVFMGIDKMLERVSSTLAFFLAFFIAPNRLCDFLTFTAPAMVDTAGGQPLKAYNQRASNNQSLNDFGEGSDSSSYDSSDEDMPAPRHAAPQTGLRRNLSFSALTGASFWRGQAGVSVDDQGPVNRRAFADDDGQWSGSEAALLPHG